MAFLTSITCSICGETKQEVRSTTDYSRECHACQAAAKDRSEREWRSGREGLTLEARIRDIEHFMYHHGTHYKGQTVLG